MATLSNSSRFYATRPPPPPVRPGLMLCLKLILFSGPKVLLTSQISGKCAAFMILLCAPSLLFCAILTLPAQIFQSPQQHAYYYFSLMLDEDPTRWIAMLLVGLCVILALALPATMAAPRKSDDY